MTGNTEKKEFDFGDWLGEGLEGMLGSKPKMSSKMPAEFREHTKAAFREMLLAYRSLLDSVIAKTEEESETPVTKIRVE